MSGRSKIILLAAALILTGSLTFAGHEPQKAVKAQDFKVQSAMQERQVRVTGKKRDDLQAVIQFLRSKDFGVGLGFTNFRD